MADKEYKNKSVIEQHFTTVLFWPPKIGDFRIFFERGCIFVFHTLKKYYSFINFFVFWDHVKILLLINSFLHAYHVKKNSQFCIM